MLYDYNFVACGDKQKFAVCCAGSWAWEGFRAWILNTQMLNILM